MDTVLKLKGKTEDLTVCTNMVQIKSRLFGRSNFGIKEIPLNDITSVQYRQATVFAVGFLQFSHSGSSNTTGKNLDLSKDENTVTFSVGKNVEFKNAKTLIQDLINKSKNQSPVSVESQNDLNDLEKLAELHQKGVLTDDEFTAKKKQLLGI